MSNPLPKICGWVLVTYTRGTKGRDVEFDVVVSHHCLLQQRMGLLVLYSVLLNSSADSHLTPMLRCESFVSPPYHIWLHVTSNALLCDEGCGAADRQPEPVNKSIHG